MEKQSSQPDSSQPSSSWEKYSRTMTGEKSCFDLARQGDMEGLKEKLDSLLDIDQKNEKGHSLLMLSAYNGNEDTAKFLLSRGADPNSIDEAGNSILMGVAFKGYSNIIKLLLEYGADPNYRNPKGQRALQFAEMFGREEAASLLSSDEPRRKSTLISILRSWMQYFTQSIFKGGRR